MKTARLLIIGIVMLLGASTTLAQTPPPSETIDSLKKRVDEQREMITYLRKIIDGLDSRLKSIEEMPEIKIPRGIKANLRMLEQAVGVYCLENKVLGCHLADLVGPGKLLKPLTIFDGESYENLRLALDEPQWKIESKYGFSLIHRLHAVDPKLIEGFKKWPNQAAQPTPGS